MLISSTGAIEHAADDSDDIKRLCMAGFNAAMSQARQTPPEGMGDFTCSCFAEEINGKGIAFIIQAQQICKERAAERYAPLLNNP